MELVALIWLCAGVCLAIMFHKLYSSGLLYCIKWLVIYTILKWRRFSTNHRELGVPIFASKKEEHLENPRIWSREKTFRRDSMLVFAGSPNVWLLLELARGRHNSAAARLRLQFGPSGPVYQTSEQDSRPRACDGWTTNSLALQCLEPMRRWRIVFTGRLHSRSSSGQKDTKLVKINLIWVALSGPYYYGNDANISAVTADLAEHPFSNLGINLESLGKGYEQWGVVQGTANIDGSVTNIHVPSLRSHCWKWPHVSARLAVVGIVGDGTLFSIGYNFAKFRTQLGHVRYTDGRIETLVGTSDVDSLAVGDKFVRTFKSGCYDHQAYVVRSQFQPWGPQHIALARCTFDSSQATCVLLSWVKGVPEDLPSLPLLQCSLTESVELVIPLDHPACTNPAVVGGKAASLALLLETTHTLLRSKAVVPAGFCLTVHAMRLQAQSSQPLSSAVKLLSLVSSGQEPGDLPEHCQHAVTAWLTVPMCTAVLSVLSGHVVADRSYAVRSSSTTEDAADTSAAGQNATVLGCVGLDAVVAAVHKCWSSLYTYQSIQYRRQSGQQLDVSMAVVVQEMVEATLQGSCLPDTL
ncbi:uncharacterized protein LOC124355171 [Homalodisca vitripennis]|uniref:uncharacterized protein LOC124355171 n=1 Tax=Homalodisca vitripennis TaxID=197043 RepID=UPI001EEB8B2B|nr:uncharacterized protein LOC124355171 [Homalodisca vitripennis]